MAKADAFEFHVKFPGSLEYIPAVRKYVSETLLANNFDPKFTYRSEIIVDEICNNAVTYGCVSVDAIVELLCTIHDNQIEFMIKDEGGKDEDLQRLTDAVKKRPKRVFPRELGKNKKESLGLEIVRMLSDEVYFEVDPNNLTTVRIIKQREEEAQDQDQETEQAANERRP